MIKALRFSNAQKVFIIKRGEEGVPAAEINREAWMSQPKHFNWRRKYAGLMPPEMRPLRELEQKNTVVDQSRDKPPHDIIKRNVSSTPSSQGPCAVTTQLAQMYSTSLRKPCDFKLFRLHLPVARKSLRRVRAIVLDPFAQHALMDIQIAGRLRYAEAAFTHLLHRLKLVIAAEFPLLHSIAPVSWQTL